MDGVTPLVNEDDEAMMMMVAKERCVFDVYSPQKTNNCEVVNVAQIKKLTPRRKPQLNVSSQSPPRQEGCSRELRRTLRVENETIHEIVSPSNGNGYEPTTDDDDDSVEDENYKMDPNELRRLYESSMEDSDDNMRSSNKRMHLHNATHEVEIGNATTIEPAVEDEYEDDEADNETEGVGANGYESQDSIEAFDDIAAIELAYDDEEMMEIRRQQRSMREHQRSFSWSREPRVRGQRANFSESLPQNTSNAPIKEMGTTSVNWPSYFNTYEGGYQSDQRESDDEQPLQEESDEEEEESNGEGQIHRLRQNRRKKAKGLVSPVHEIWPNIEHRQCARHIFTNWRKKHKGLELERQFWRCVKASSMGEFETESGILKMMSNEAYDDFMERDPDTFCKSHFKTFCSCDCVDNNMAETFNSFILLARYKPIVTMLEDIGHALMERMKNKKKLVEKFVAGIAPRISLKLEKSFNEQIYCECKWNGEDSQTGFEVIHRSIGHVVDLKEKSCSCRLWDLTGIPCTHAMSAILYMKLQPEDFIAKWYNLDTYIATYSTLLQPVQGSKFWDHIEDKMIMPPLILRKKPGRRRLNRIKDPNEPPKNKNKNKICRDGLPCRCSRCGSTEHNKRKCPMPAPPPPPPKACQRVSNNADGHKKRGRPKGSKSRIGRPLDEVQQPAEYRAQLRGLRGARSERESIVNVESTTPRPWLDVVNAAATIGRGRGR